MSKKFSSANGVLATMSDEGDADGKHLHMQVNVGTMKGKPVDQFKWLDNRMNGIATTVKIDNRGGTMQYAWNNEANALVNPSERIAMIRADRINAAGKQEVYARTFAWEDGKTMDGMVEVVWKSVKYEGESLPQERWVMLSDDTQEWDSKIRKFITKKKV